MEPLPTHVTSSTPPRKRWPALACVALGLLMAVAPQSVSRMYSWPWYLAWQLLFLLPPLLLVHALLRSTKPLRRFRSWTDIGLGLGLVAHVLSACNAELPGPGLGLLSQSLAWVCWAYLLLNHTPPALLEIQPTGAHGHHSTHPHSDRLWSLVGVGAGIFVVISLGLWVGESLPNFLNRGPLGDPPRNEIPFGHSLYVGGLAVLCVPVLVHNTLRADGDRRWLWALGAIAAVVIIFTTKSRAALAGLVLGAAALLPAWWITRRPPLRHVLVCAAALLALGVTAALLDPRLSVLLKTGKWGESALASNLQRSAMLKAGLEMGAESPLLGKGPGMVPLSYPRFASGTPGAAPTVYELHSTPVQVWAEMGTLGVIAMALVQTGMVVMMAKCLHNRTSAPRDFVPAYALLSALVGYSVVAWTDFQLDVPAIAAMLVVLLVLLSRQSQLSDTRRPPSVLSARSARLAAVFILLVLGVSTTAQWRECRARHQFVKAVQAAEAGDVGGFLEAAYKASQIDPQTPFYPTQLASKTAQLSRTGNPELAKLLPVFLTRSLLIWRDQDYVLNALAWQSLQQDPKAAEHHFRIASTLAPGKRRLCLGLALALHNQGKDLQAARVLALEFVCEPASAILPLWEDPSLTDLHEAALALTHPLTLELGNHPTCTPELRVRLVYDRMLARWWETGKASDMAELLKVTPAHKLALMKQLAALEAREDVGVNPGAIPPSLARLRNIASTGSLPKEGPFVLALNQLAATHPASLHQLLRAPVGDRPALCFAGASMREGYGLLMRNHDGWPLVDTEVIAENSLVHRCLPWLFSPAGEVPQDFILIQLARTFLAE